MQNADIPTWVAHLDAPRLSPCALVSTSSSLSVDVSSPYSSGMMCSFVSEPFHHLVSEQPMLYSDGPSPRKRYDSLSRLGLRSCSGLVSLYGDDRIEDMEEEEEDEDGVWGWVLEELAEKMEEVGEMLRD